MAAQSPPFVLATGSHSAALFREAVSSLLATTGGVVGLGDLLVTQNGTPNMSVNVASGEIWIPGTSATGNDDAPQGQYFGYNDATVNLAVSAANATNPRIDKVCATVEDAAYAGSNNDWKLQVVTGTPTAGATLSNLTGAAATPSNSVVIAYVLVPANATTIVTADLLDNRPFAAPNLPLRGNPGGKLHGATGQSLSDNSQTTITLGSIDNLSGGVTQNGSGLLIPTTGYYSVTGQIRNAGFSGTWIRMFVQLFVAGTGATLGGDTFCTPGASTGSPTATVHDDRLFITAGSTLTLQGYQHNSASAAQSLASDTTNFLSATLVSI